MNRRQCMISVGAAGMAGLASWASAQAPASSRPFFAHHAIPLGVQLYALQPDLEADFDGTLAKLNGIGIRSVEMAWFHGRRSGLPSTERGCNAPALTSPPSPTARRRAWTGISTRWLGTCMSLASNRSSSHSRSCRGYRHRPRILPRSFQDSPPGTRGAWRRF